MDAAFNELQRSLPPDRKVQLVRQVIHDLSIHAAIEEQLLYPLVNRFVPDGSMLADDSVDDHQRVKDLLSWLDTARPEASGYDRHMFEMIEEVREHVDEEETTMFPALRTAVPQGKLDEVGIAMERARAGAPTRPHPHAPNLPPVNTVAVMTALMVDAVRDRLTPGTIPDRVVVAAASLQDLGARAGQGAWQTLTRALPGATPLGYGAGQAGPTQLFRRGVAVTKQMAALPPMVLIAAARRGRGRE